MIKKLKISSLSLFVISLLMILTAFNGLTNVVKAADMSITPSNGYSITSDKTFVLNQDCTINSGSVLVDNKTISNVNLNGHKLTSNVTFPIVIETNQNVQISNGTIQLDSIESNGLDISEEPNITVESVTFKSDLEHCFGMAVWGGNITVSSSTFDLPDSTGIAITCGKIEDEIVKNPTVNVVNGTKMNTKIGITTFNGESGNSTVNIGDVNMYGSQFTIATDGGDEYIGEATINIGYPNGSTNSILTGGIASIYSGNANTEINVENGTISGPSGIDVLGGKINLHGGTITGNGNPKDIVPPEENDCFIWDGSAVFIEEKPTTTDNYGNAVISIGGSTAGQPILESTYTNTIGSNATGSQNLNILNMITINNGSFIASEGTANISESVSNAFSAAGQTYKDHYVFCGNFSDPVDPSLLADLVSYGFYGTTNRGTSVYGYYTNQANAQAGARAINPNNPPTVVEIDPANPNLGPNNAEIQLSTKYLYLAPQGTPNGITSETITAIVTNSSVDPSSVVWECDSTELTLSETSGLTNVISATTTPGSYRITVYIKGSSSPQGTCYVNVSDNSLVMDAEKSVIEVTSPDYYTVKIVPIVNPAIQGLDTAAKRVSIFTWSQVGQTDMDCKAANNNGDETFSYIFPVNNTPVNNYYIDGAYIKVHVYASEDATTDGTMISNFYWNYSECDWEKGIIATPYMQDQGFITPSVGNGEVVGIPGENRSLEGIRLSAPYDMEGVDIVYDVHVRNLGWMDEVPGGIYVGTMNRSLLIEAIHIGLTGDNADNYTIQYQAYVQNQGWQNWVADGVEAGTTGQNLGIEALRIQLVPKGTPLPTT